MKRLAPTLLLVTLCFASTDSFARGGFSSAGRGGFSASRSFSSPSRSYSTPRAGGTTTVTRTTTVNRYSGGYGGGYHPMVYPGFGMGYGYSNGLLTGLIIGNMMHPTGTVVYTGGGYNGNALLYPDGRVVNQSGYQVGTYSNGQFVPMQGGLVAQQVPPDFQPPQPVTIEETNGWEIAGGVIVGLLFILVICAIFA